MNSAAKRPCWRIRYREFPDIRTGGRVVPRNAGRRGSWHGAMRKLASCGVSGAPSRLGALSRPRGLRVSAGVPNDLMIIAGSLRRPEPAGELVELAGEAERHRK